MVIVSDFMWLLNEYDWHEFPCKVWFYEIVYWDFS